VFAPEETFAVVIDCNQVETLPMFACQPSGAWSIARAPKLENAPTRAWLYENTSAAVCKTSHGNCLSFA
jgi:hypothetical protein